MKRSLLCSALLFAVSGMSAMAAEAELHGQDMPLGKPISIAAALSDPGHWSGRYGKFEGRVTEVCQNKGCWLVLADGDRYARVFTGHKFFLPMNFRGEAVIYGRLGQRTLSEAFARHLAEDSGRDPDAVSGEQVEYRIDARSIQLLPAP